MPRCPDAQKSRSPEAQSPEAQMPRSQDAQKPRCPCPDAQKNVPEKTGSTSHRYFEKVSEIDTITHPDQHCHPTVDPKERSNLKLSRK